MARKMLMEKMKIPKLHMDGVDWLTVVSHPPSLYGNSK
jgi:hypothetical protein